MIVVSRPDVAEARLLLEATEREPGEDLGSWLDDARNVMLSARVDDAPAGLLWGYVLPRPDGDEMLLIYDVEVLPDARQRGVGKALVDAARALARGRAWVVTDASNAAAMALYASAGGHRSRDDDVVFGFPCPAEVGQSPDSQGDSP